MSIIRLEQFDELSVKNGEIHSGGLGPCIAVGIYHKSSKSAWMIHHPNMDVDHPLESFLKNVLRKIKNKTSLAVYATGASNDDLDEDTAEKCRNAKQYVEKALSTVFEDDQIFIQWGGRNEITELIIDTINDEVRKEVEGNIVLLNEFKPPSADIQYDSTGEIIDY